MVIDLNKKNKEMDSHLNGDYPLFILCVLNL